METLWTFKTRNFEVLWQVEQEYGYRYDGDDEDGETQAALDSGDMVAFQSKVSVLYKGEEVGTDYLGGSVYRAGEIETFHRHHIGSRGGYGSYFTDMVREAIGEARKTLRESPYIRTSAK